MQIALNAPFALLWIADKTNPAVHAFNMTALSAMHAEMAGTDDRHCLKLNSHRAHELFGQR